MGYSMRTQKQPFFLILVTYGVLLQAQAQDPFTNGLVAYYPFHANAHDLSGNGNHGALIGSDWQYAADRFGEPNALYLNTESVPSLSLDGAYVVVPRSASLDFDSNFTMCVWVNLGHFTNWYPHNLISNGPDTNYANLRIGSQGDAQGRDFLQYVFKTDSQGYPDPSGSIQTWVDALDGTWWQFCAVRSNGSLSLFRNGSRIAGSGITATTANASEIWLGKHRVPYLPVGIGSVSMIGGIDDVRMYDRALSNSEIQQLYLWERNPLPNLSIAIKTIRLTLLLEVGTSNLLEVSTGLTNWTPYKPPFVATSSIAYEDVDVLESKQFFRVRSLTP